MARRRTTKQSGEDLLIANYFRPIARHPGARGLIDDAAYLAPPKGHELVLKTDAIVGGVHFFNDDPPDTVARKALGVNLSDLASKGAKPAGFLLTLALPKDCGHGWLKPFARGLGAMAKRYGCPLLGGDTVMTPGPVTISIAAFGTLPKGTGVERSGARAGDVIVVTGTIGDAALGLKLRTDIGAIQRWKLDAKMRAHLAERYLVPQPRNAIADAVRRYGFAMNVLLLPPDPTTWAVAAAGAARAAARASVREADAPGRHGVRGVHGARIMPRPRRGAAG